MEQQPQQAFNLNAPFPYQQQGFTGHLSQQPFHLVHPGHGNTQQAPHPALPLGHFAPGPGAHTTPFKSARPSAASPTPPIQQQNYQQQLFKQQQHQNASNGLSSPPPVKAPMANSSSHSPSTSTSTNQGQHHQRPQFPSYQAPTTPEGISRERERITAILQVNSELLQYISKLQSDGQGGQIGAQQPGDQQPQPAKTPSSEYLQCMRALQTNIAFCAAVGDGGRSRQGQTFPGPAIMQPPAKTDTLVATYGKMQALFPEWKGIANVMGQRQQQMAAQQRAQQQMQQLQQQQQQQQQQMTQALGGQAGYNPGIMGGSMTGHQNG